MSDGQESVIKKDLETLVEGEERKEGEFKRWKIHSPVDIPQKVTKIEVFFNKDEEEILSLAIHGQEGDPQWAGRTEEDWYFIRFKGRKETFEVP